MSADWLTYAPAPSASELDAAKQLIDDVRSSSFTTSLTEPDAHDFSSFLTTATALRYLRARKFNLKKATAMLTRSVKWRLDNQIHAISCEDVERFSTEGKMWVANKTDKKGRNVLVMDNDKEVPNSTSRKDQMRFLAWNLERSIRRNRLGRQIGVASFGKYATPLKSKQNVDNDDDNDEAGMVEKHVVFIKLDEFKLSTSPSIGSTLDTIDVVCNHYPERLGLAILYRPPKAFNALWSVAKRALDPTTQQKLLVVSDASPGSAGERDLEERLGPHWREISGIGQPTGTNAANGRRVSSGYCHKDVWRLVHLEEEAWRQHVRASSSKSEDTAASPAPAPFLSADDEEAYYSAEEFL